jgi:anti-sigma factor RsiW
VTTCHDVDDGLDELALGLLDPAEAEPLLAHAAGCPRCQARLDELAALADRLLLVAPEAEPPAGFEAGALARMGGRPVAAPRPTRRRWVAAVAVVLVALAAGTLLGRGLAGRGDDGVARRGTIVASTGAEVGTVQLLSSPSPHVLVDVQSPQPAPGARTCELELPDGRRVVVGSWTYDDIATGIWAVGVDAPLLDAVAMRVLAADGTVIATAALS